jgi:hypothetical protein
MANEKAAATAAEALRDIGEGGAYRAQQLKELIGLIEKQVGQLEKIEARLAKIEYDTEHSRRRLGWIAAPIILSLFAAVTWFLTFVLMPRGLNP